MKDDLSKTFLRLFEKLERKSLLLVKSLTNNIDDAEKQIDDAIRQLYADMDDVSLQNANSLLSDDEKEQFYLDVERYHADALKVGASKAWLSYLNGMRSRKRVSRIQSANTHIRAAVMGLGEREVAVISDAIVASYEGAYYYTAYEIQRNLRQGWLTELLDVDDLTRALRKRWGTDGELFSGRIWNNKQKMMQAQENELKHSIMQGNNVNKAIKRIDKLMDTERYNARRHIRTESAYYA